MLGGRVCTLAFSLVAVAIGTAFGQQGSLGSLTGTVTDPSGAAVPGVVVTATNIATNVESKATTTSKGVYRIGGLIPGTYTLSTLKTGFDSAQIPAFEVHVAELVTVNIPLQVGRSSQAVTVNAEAPLVDASTSQLNHYVTPKELEDWPVPVTGDGERQLQDFVFKSLPGTTGETFIGSINGGQNFANEVVIDGISLGTFDTAELGPSMDAVGEFNLQTGAMSAQYGGGSTAVTNFSIKSGTNKLQGTVYTYIQNEALDANSFDNNAFGTPRPRQRLETYGGAIGGPVFIPKIYDGRNKTFFFVSDEQTQKNNFIYSGFTTLPTTDMMNGNFSKWLNPLYTQDPRSGSPAFTPDGTPVVDNLGRPVIFGQIYNPATARTVTAGAVDPVTGLTAIKTGLVRDPFPNNIIPTSMFDPVAVNYLKLPYTGAKYINGAVVNNVAKYANNQPVFNQNLFSMKIDEVINSNHRVSAYYTQVGRDRSNSGNATWSVPGANPLDTWDNQHNPGHIARISEDWTISAHMLNHLGYGYNRFTNEYTTPFYTKDWASTLGIQNTESFGFPTVSFSGPSSLGGGIDGIGNGSNGAGDVAQSSIFLEQFTLIHGGHTMQMGTEFRFYNENDVNVSGVGSFAFNNRQTDDGFGSLDYAGNAYASFLLGQVNTSGRAIAYTNAGFRRHMTGTFFQDDWKVTPHLTLNLGLRWEVMGGIDEVAGRMTRFDPAKPNPGADGRLGALDFASQDHIQSWEHTDWHLFSPRFGFAYARTQRFVFRGGYGINTQAPEGGPQLQFQGSPSIQGYNGQIQINHATHPTQYPDLPTFILSNPYPSFSGTLPNYDPSQANNQTPPQYIGVNGARVSYTQNYTLGFQYQVSPSTIADVNWVGNYTTRLNTGGSNGGDLGSMNYLPVSDIAKYGDALLDPLASHPSLPLPYAGFDTTQLVQQAIVPYPQYPGGSIFEYDNHTGWSHYESLQVQVTRRVSSGFSILAAYTWSKNLTDTNGGTQDLQNRRLEYAVASGLHYPHVAKFTMIYNLPIGPNGLIHVTGWKNSLFGGWLLSGNTIYQSGDVLSISDSSAVNGIFTTTRPDYVSGQQVALGSPGGFDIANPNGPSGSQYLNPAAFARVPTTCSLVAPGQPCNGIALRPGTAPSTLPNIRGPWLANESLSLQKNFRLGEKRDIQFRAEMFNLLNRAGKADPVTDINDPNFGKILGPGSDSQNIDSDSYFYQPRVIQLSLRVHF